MCVCGLWLNLCLVEPVVLVEVVVEVVVEVEVEVVVEVEVEVEVVGTRSSGSISNTEGVAAASTRATTAALMGLGGAMRSAGGK